MLLPAHILHSRLLFSLIAACFICSSFCEANVSNDIQILITLKDSLVLRRDLLPSWFNTEVSPCNWSGIRCVGSKVVEVDLSCTQFPLQLPFPSHLGELRALKRLNVSYCALTGHLPTNIWYLENLESLDLGGNKLFGTLPPSLSNLKMLRELILDENSFTGSLPSTIGELGNLIELSVRGNSLSGNLPPGLGNLQNLVSLDLSMNLFSGNLPPSIGNLTRLLYLDANRNKFSGVIPQELGNLVQLRKLDLSMNSLEGPIPLEIGRMSVIQSLTLGNNNLLGELPATVGNLRELQVLDLENCQLIGALPNELSYLRNLTLINIAQNSFEGEIPSSFGELSNLIYLVAANSGLSGRIPGNLGNCKKLKILNLSFNSLSGPLPEGLMGLESLSSLVLDSNHLSGPIPSWISNWTRVNSIMLSRNQFKESLPPLNLPYLTRFDATSNQLSGEIPEEICLAGSLTTLTLSENQLSGSIQNTFRRCLALTDLQLIGNNLFGEIPGYLGELQLVTLELSHNKFSGRLPDELWKSQTLMEISFSNNFLVGHIPSAIASLTYLQRLQLDNNLFDGPIPRSVEELRNLTNLSLHGNQLSGEIPLELFNCINIVSLDLGANKLTGSIPRSISRLKLLDNLVLSENHLSGSIPDEICSGFQKAPLPDSEFTQHYGMLDLSYNELVGPIPTTIEHCTILSELLLQENKLNGSIPREFSGLINLTVLDLSSNYLTGPAIPHFFAPKNLQGLFLSHNQLNGSIPKDLGSMMPSLAKLNLSRNLLTGALPSTIFNVKSLSYIDVSDNSLSGSISFPTINGGTSVLLLNASNNLFSGTLSESLSNLTTLAVLDLHNNSLTGTLPSSLSNISTLAYLDVSNNDFHYIPCVICTMLDLAYVNFSGNKLSEYEKCTISGSCPSKIYSTVQTYPSSPALNKACVWGITLGATFSFLFLLFGLLRWRMLKNESMALTLGKTKSVTVNESATTDEFLLKKPKEPLSINIATFEHSLLRVSASDILTATENFSKTHIIGDGGFGTVYKGLLPEGKTIAVKRLNGGHFQGDREFLAEMETIGKVKHENLVPLQGYCVFGDERFLVYEYMENGSLDMWLRNRADAVESLNWPARFKICLGSARGLAFLHHGFVPHIIHRDIKSSNILLDKKLEARVADFGLARIISACESHVSTVLAGTFGYIPPEYGQIMVATTKGDVYSFGVVMLELLTGRAPTGQTDIEGGNLVGWVRWMMEMGMDDEVLDPCVVSMNGSFRDQMRCVLEIARECTLDEPWKRPTMLEVVKLLKEVKMEDSE
ncbi:hypothetical protein MKX01_014449 [Papaver californicum]|nr:hypothetical protein MKX01_014449 [Papaver californicum]